MPTVGRIAMTRCQSNNDQTDYLLVSEALAAPARSRDRAARLWANAKKTSEKYPPLTTVTGDSNSASDHAAVWADFDL